MKTKLVLAVVAVAGLFAGNAQAQFYVGGGVSQSSYDYDDVNNSSGNRIFGGYYTKNNFLFELASIRLGAADVDATSLELEMKGLAAYVGYKSSAPTGFGWFGKLGVYSLNTELSASGGGSVDDDSTGAAVGLGLTYAFTSTVALRGEIESFVGVKDFGDDGNVTGGAVGVEIRF